MTGDPLSEKVRETLEAEGRMREAIAEVLPRLADLHVTVTSRFVQREIAAVAKTLKQAKDGKR